MDALIIVNQYWLQLFQYAHTDTGRVLTAHEQIRLCTIKYKYMECPSWESEDGSQCRLSNLRNANVANLCR